VSLDIISVPAKWHLHPSNGLSMVYQCERRQTDNATEKRVAIYAQSLALQEAIPPNNTK